MVKGSTELSLCPQVAAHWDLGLIKGWWVLPRSPPASQLSSVPRTSYALGMNSECQSRGDGAAMGSGPTDPRRSPSTPHAHVQLAGAGPVPQPHSCPSPPPSPASVPNHSVIPIHSGEHPLPTPPATKCLCFSKVWVLSTCLYPCIPHVRHKPRADSIPKGSGERESEQQCCRWALPQKQHLCPGPPLPAQLLSAALSANKVTVSWYA